MSPKVFDVQYYLTQNESEKIMELGMSGLSRSKVDGNSSKVTRIAGRVWQRLARMQNPHDPRHTENGVFFLQSPGGSFMRDKPPREDLDSKRFTASGQHNPDFSGYVGRNGATFYLRTWLEVKKDLINFVRGGLLEDDELDTLDDTTGVNSASSQTPSKTKIHKGNESLDRLASAFTCYVDDRKVEADRVSNSLSVKVQERAQILSILGDILKPKI
eukprot:jgi/Phyca11/13725/fgenesh1_pg.PHYCAscaffold_4_\